MTIIQNSIGKPVEGNNFFGREAEQRFHWQRLATDNILLLSPRRVGKTSFMRKLRDTAESNGFKAIYLSVEDLNQEYDFVLRLYKGVLETGVEIPTLQKLFEGKLVTFFKERVKKVGAGKFSLEFTQDEKDQWRTMGEALLHALQKLDGQHRWLLMIDELPIFLMNLLSHEDNGDSRVQQFLHWLRNLRQGAPDLEHIRWLLAGSIGLDTVTELHQLTGTINDLSSTRLHAFSPETSNEFLNLLAQSYHLTFTDDVILSILEKIRWPIPFFLQLMFSKVHELCSNRDCQPSPELVHEAFEDLLDIRHRNSFDHWYQRLGKELLPETRETALVVLKAIAQSEEGCSLTKMKRRLGKLMPDSQKRDERLGFLLRVLESEGYIQRKPGAQPQPYIFRSSLLQEYWRRYYCD